MAEPLSCLSVLQPWPWAMFNADKDRENHVWRPPRHAIGRRIAIHASKSTVELRDPNVREFIEGISGKLWTPEAITLGAVVGTVLLTGFDLEPTSPWHVPGQIGWRIAEPRELSRPIPMRGQLGLWKLPEEIAAQVREQEAARAA